MMAMQNQTFLKPALRKHHNQSSITLRVSLMLTWFWWYIVFGISFTLLAVMLSGCSDDDKGDTSTSKKNSPETQSQSTTSRKPAKNPIVSPPAGSPVSPTPSGTTIDICANADTRCQRLTNYCLDTNDNILACDGRKNMIRLISPEDKLLADWNLDFSPQAIECSSDGNAIVAGPGQIAVLDQKGNTIRTAKIPGKSASGVGVSGDDIFVAVREEMRYNVYRLNSQLSEPKQIISGLRGCCSQMDITAQNGVVYVAANCLFKVIKYDREGKEITRFGEKGRVGDQYFKGCCEPKNVFVDDQGNIYTSESGSRSVKKFSGEGKFLGLVGRLAGHSGCVRMSVAVSRDGSRVYILDTTKNRISVMNPKAVSVRQVENDETIL
jgi:DNA-binding beta-propeller fold protein YncE